MESIGSFGRSLTCYVCGRLQMALDLEEHLEECKDHFIMKERQLPRNERRGLPKQPKGLHLLLGKYSSS